MNKTVILKFFMFAMLTLSILTFVSCENADTNDSCTEHSFGPWTVVTAPSCYNEGKDIRVCKNCAEIEIKSTDKTEHSYIDHICDVCSYSPYSIGLSYTLSEDGTSYIVSGIGSCTDKNIKIMPSINSIPVTEISERAFMDAKTVESIVVPDSVLYIKSYAFALCPDLRSVDLPKSVVSIGEGILNSCPSLEKISVNTENPLYKSSGNTIIEKANNVLIVGCKTSIIPDTVKTIGYGAFIGCEGLTDIILPNSVSKIEERAFYRCTSLSSIKFTDNVTEIGNYAFSMCSSLKSIELPKNIEQIAFEVFSESGLEAITIPSSVRSIEFRAFYNCVSLKNITIDGTVQVIDNPFIGCSSLTKISFNGTKSHWISYNVSLGLNEISGTVFCNDGTIAF